MNHCVAARHKIEHADLSEPSVLAAEIVALLQTAMDEMQGLHEDLGA